MAIHQNHEPGIPCTEFCFTGEDGLRIACARWDSRAPTRAIVQIAHGIGEHIGCYTGIIEVFVSAGFTVYANDHRGHGRSARDFGDGGFALLVEDMVRLSGVARREMPDLPIILLGHGMGSFAAQQYVLDHSREIDALVLSGSGDLAALARLADSGSPGFEPTRIRADWLSSDKLAVGALTNDPCCFRNLRPASFASFLGAASRLSDLVNLRKIRSDLPIYLLSGSADPLGQHHKGVRSLIERYRKAGIVQISRDLYIGGQREMLLEINHSEVQARLLSWMAAQVGRFDCAKSSERTKGNTLGGLFRSEGLAATA
jgi:alpha-beta hydrolase superfamily lysophospholipase